VSQAARKTPEEALRISVDALGGLQSVGAELRPESDVDPIISGQWLSHCLTASKRDKLSLRQIAWIFRKAHNIGEHAGFEQFAALCGYTATPVAPAQELAELRHQADAAVRAAHDAARDLELLIDNPRLFATMRAAGLKIE
jgi:hypothetical protein